MALRNELRRSPRDYVYRVKYDGGGAPCVFRGVLSLAICKPVIRASAEVGDWLFGFGAQRLGGRLIYIAQITSKPDCGNYYRIPKFAARPDCIYEWRRSRLEWRKGGRFHPNGKDARKDIGLHPEYARAHVLLSSNFRYFGSNGTTEWETKFPRLRAVLKRLTQGHRVHHIRPVSSELAALKEWCWAASLKSVLGRPSDEFNRSCPH